MNTTDLKWNEIYNRGIDVANIRRDSEEYQIMYSAAVRGIPSAEYYLGLWVAKVNKRPDVARIWLDRAASKDYQEASETIQGLNNETGFSTKNSVETSLLNTQNVNTNYRYTDTTNPTTSLDIREHDFQETKNSLKKYTEQVQQDVELSRVPTDGGLFNLGDHKVTGYELNRITSQIQNYLINFNTLSQGLVDEFREVYNAFEYLDKDYISGIVASIKAIQKVSEQEQKDRKDIRQLVDQHEQSVAVLKKFKADIDKLKHLTDIDKVWELIEKQTKLSNEFSNYMAELAKVKHLKNVDELYADFEKLKKDFSKVSNMQSKYASELKSVSEYCNALSKLQHINDIDQLWDYIELVVVMDIQNIKNSLDNQKQEIFDIHKKSQCLQETQQQFIDKANQLISNFREDINNHVKVFTEAQTTKLNDIDRNYTNAIERLLGEQEEKFVSIEKTLANSLDTTVQEQASAIHRIEKRQEEKFEELSVNQSSVLEQISNNQSIKLTEIQKLLEEEKAVYNEQVNILTQAVDRLSVEQEEKFVSIEKTLTDSLATTVQEQASAIHRIEKRQEEKFEELLVNQSSALEQISSNQSIKLAEINKSFEEEKTVYRDQINVLTKKVKFLYIVAGGATALTVIQLILNFLGVL